MSEAIQKAAVTLVDRAREGDQNAMAMLAEIAKNRASNMKARVAFGYALDYTKKNPPRIRTIFGQERRTSFAGLAKAKGGNGNAYGRTLVAFVLDMGPSIRDCQIAGDVVAQLRPVDRDALRRVLAATPSDIRPFFAISYRNPNGATKEAEGLEPIEMKALQLGYILGMARKLQELQKDETPISSVFPRVGWELGE